MIKIGNFVFGLVARYGTLLPFQNQIRKLGHWYFCKIDNPIWSPSQSILQNKGKGKFVCIHCGKHHGTLPQQQKDYYENLVKPVQDKIREWRVEL